MAKSILLVESDPNVVESVRAALEQRGVTVEHTGEGKGCVDLVRRTSPALVVLAVELPAGQNGYLVCREIKKDDNLKAIPVVIIGNPEKFADHKKLRTHADAYVAKPLQLPELLDEVSTLLGGFPQEPAIEEGGATLDPPGDDSLSLSDLLDDEAPLAEEIAVEPESAPAESAADPNLALLDSALDGPSTSVGEEPVLMNEPVFDTSEPVDDSEVSEVDADDVLSALDDAPTVAEEDTALGAAFGMDTAPPEPEPEPEPERSPPPPTPLRTGASADAAELRSLRARSTELQGELDRAESRATDAEERVTALEAELAAKASELESKSAGGAKSDKEFFALREQANKKDKEILRLKTELNEKEQGELEMREREVQLEQKLSEQSAELTKKDSQLKTLTTRADTLLADKKRAETQAQAVKDETRTATDRIRKAEERTAELEAELETLRAESDPLRGRLDALEQQLEDTKTQLVEQTTTYAEEGAGLRTRVSELEAQIGKHEQRVAKLYQRIKDDEKLRDRVKKAMTIASQLLEEPAPSIMDDDGSVDDEPRAA